MRFCLLALALLAVAAPAAAQPADTSRVVTRWLPDPPTAVRRAAFLPGGGQIYNQQYWKLPIVYGALAGAAGWALYQNSRYLDYRHAYLYIAYQNLVEAGTNEAITENPFPQYQDDYEALIASVGEVSESTLRAQRDILRRNRDLTYFAIGALYGLSVLDAYVSAHLLRFDVSEDLSLQFHPPAAMDRPAVGLTFRW